MAIRTGAVAVFACSLNVLATGHRWTAAWPPTSENPWRGASPARAARTAPAVGEKHKSVQIPIAVHFSFFIM